MMDELELLKGPDSIQPCEETQRQLDAIGNTRSLSLSDLKGPKGFCVWCAKPLPPRKKRWCSDDCVHSAQFRCYPQDPAAKIYRLIFTQNWACKICGESFEDELREKIAIDYARINSSKMYILDKITDKYRQRTPEDPKELLTLHTLGYGTGDLWQTDHIVPIHKGGAGIDPGNLQTVCTNCHKAKTARDKSR